MMLTALSARLIVGCVNDNNNDDNDDDDDDDDVDDDDDDKGNAITRRIL